MEVSHRVAIVEDDPDYGPALRDLVLSEPDCERADLYETPARALAAAGRPAASGGGPPWDLVLMDIELPGFDGIEATGRLKALHPGLTVVMLTAFEDSGRILGAICAGADGYLVKKSDVGEVLEEIRAVLSGGSPLTASVARSILSVLRSDPRAGALRAASAAPTRIDLSEREIEVLRQLVQGRSYKEIGAALFISADTVRSHIRKIYRKMQVHSASAAVSRAIREGIV